MYLVRSSFMRLWQGLILLAALDSAVVGGWAAVRPTDLFTLFQQPPNDDGLLLCRLLGVLYLCHALFLILAARRPAAFANLVLVPLLGRLVLCGVWLWLLASGRMPAASNALLALLTHDAVWLPVFAGFLWSVRRAPV